jgi:hypothetical protein
MNISGVIDCKRRFRALATSISGSYSAFLTCGISGNKRSSALKFNDEEHLEGRIKDAIETATPGV